MRLVWRIEDEWDDDYDGYTRVVGIREGLSEWWLNWRSRNNPPKTWPTAYSTEPGYVIDMDPVIAMLDPDMSMFQTMLLKIPMKSGVVVEWLEDTLFPRVGSIVLWGEWDWIEP